MAGTYTEASDKGQSMFADIAAKSGWPQDIIDKVSVQMDPTGVNLKYDEALDEQIFNLEYGYLGQPARAAMRRFEHRSKDDVAKLRLEEMFKRIKKSGAL